jgi:hypothetical protein
LPSGSLKGTYSTPPRSWTSPTSIPHSAGRSLLVDTKYKVLDPKKRHGGSRRRFSIRCTPTVSAGKRYYDEIVLLYPTSKVVQRTFHQGEIRLHVRKFDPRNIFDTASGNPNEREVVEELSRALFMRR